MLQENFTSGLKFLINWGWINLHNLELLEAGGEGCRLLKIDGRLVCVCVTHNMNSGSDNRWQLRQAFTPEEIHCGRAILISACQFGHAGQGVGAWNPRLHLFNTRQQTVTLV